MVFLDYRLEPVHTFRKHSALLYLGSVWLYQLPGFYRYEEEEIEESLPMEERIDVFIVKCALVKRLLVEGSRQQRAAFLTTLSRTMVDQCLRSQKSLKKIKADAEKPVEGLEDVYELKVSLETAPEKVKEIRKDLQAVRSKMEVLRQLQWTVTFVL